MFDHHENSWFRFTSGVGWELDSDGGISRAVRGYVRELAQAREYPEKATWAAKKIAFSTAIERACQKDEHMAITRERWDADPFLLGVPGGHIDLQTGDVHPASPNRFIRAGTRRPLLPPAPRHRYGIRPEPRQRAAT